MASCSFRFFFFHVGQMLIAGLFLWTQTSSALSYPGNIRKNEATTFTNSHSSLNASASEESPWRKSDSNSISRRDHLSILRNMVVHSQVISAFRPRNANANEIEDQDLYRLINAGSDLKNKETDLWYKVQRRKPSSYSESEIEEIDTIVDDIVLLARGTEWQRDKLLGTWRVAYIRPGREGGGLDRRIPFPEFDFNESYQKFTADSVNNVGELLGPTVRIEVSGDLSEDDLDVNSTPKRFQANIRRGDLFAGNFRVKLPIEGVGIFDGVYLGEHIRIGQNLNGSGALVVQVRSDI